VAQEYEIARGFSERTSVIAKDDLARGTLQRFHAGHFRGEIGNRVYEIVSNPD
jgi:hypothetical protein